MKVLIACEYSGVVREAFRAKGHDAWSCDLFLSDDQDQTHHILGDVTPELNLGWDLMIAHPPCRYLAVSGARWFKDRIEEQEEAVRFVNLLWNAPIERICIENPVGVLPRMSQLGKASQIIQPWLFGEDASKKTCLWLKNLPLLVPTEIIVKERYANQTPSGQNKLGPSPTRAKERARTYQGIANAMAEQWG